MKLRLLNRARFFPGVDAAGKNALEYRSMAIQKMKTIVRMIAIYVLDLTVNESGKNGLAERYISSSSLTLLPECSYYY